MVVFCYTYLMARKHKDNKIVSIDVWRHLVNIWTILFFGITLFDYYTRNHYIEFMGPISTIYIAILAVYTAQKEFERWHDFNIGRHPGEVYVYGWTILIVSLFALEITHREAYKLPEPVFTTYIVVLGILAITKKSKKNYLGAK